LLARKQLSQLRIASQSDNKNAAIKRRFFARATRRGGSIRAEKRVDDTITKIAGGVVVAAIGAVTFVAYKHPLGVHMRRVGEARRAQAANDR
jgi:hypothetical protein